MSNPQKTLPKDIGGLLTKLDELRLHGRPAGLATRLSTGTHLLVPIDLDTFREAIRYPLITRNVCINNVNRNVIDGSITNYHHTFDYQGSCYYITTDSPFIVTISDPHAD